MSRTRVCLVVWALALSARHVHAAPIKVACIGEQSTLSLEITAAEQYTVKLQALLGSGFEVKNFADPKGTVLKQLGPAAGPAGLHPYMTTQPYRDSLAYGPDVVILGPWGRQDSVGTGGYAAGSQLDATKFAADYRVLVDAYLALASKPRVILALPIPIPSGMPTGPVTKAVLPAIQAAAVQYGLPTIDLYQLFVNQSADFKDAEHLTDGGRQKQAQAVFAAIKAPTSPRDAGTSAPDAANDVGGPVTDGGGGPSDDSSPPRDTGTSVPDADSDVAGPVTDGGRSNDDSSTGMAGPGGTDASSNPPPVVTDAGTTATPPRRGSSGGGCSLSPERSGSSSLVWLAMLAVWHAARRRKPGVRS